MIVIKPDLKPGDLSVKLQRFWDLSGEKIKLIDREYDESKGSPVFTMKGKYTTRGWTEWTQGFQYGSAILQYDGCGDEYFLESGRRKTLERMAPHISHTGVHDHGFNNVSTYGNLLRLMVEGKIPYNEWEKNFYEIALKISGAVQASRWTNTAKGGYIHSFNGAHSLFVDTIRSVRSLILSHSLGHSLQSEGDRKVNLLLRAVSHLRSTAEYSIFYGEDRDLYDQWGRTAHESIFNVKDGSYRCPNSQQGYSGFTTWTRGLAWAICGFAEELEWADSVDPIVLEEAGGKDAIVAFLLRGASATCDFYFQNACTDGIPYWDTGAPLLERLGDYLNKAADPFNSFEPVDSSAAAIAAQGFLRLGDYLIRTGDAAKGAGYWQAGLLIADTLLDQPYLSMDESHQGLILHSIYHRPNGWDYIPAASKIPYGESSMWGDYHMRELCVYLQRIVAKEKYYSFFNCIG